MSGRVIMTYNGFKEGFLFKFHKFFEGLEIFLIPLFKLFFMGNSGNFSSFLIFHYRYEFKVISCSPIIMQIDNLLSSSLFIHSNFFPITALSSSSPSLCEKNAIEFQLLGDRRYKKIRKKM